MGKNKANNQKRRRPIENHETAAWANCEFEQNHSQVSIPSELEVIHAKEYVDENKK